MKHWREYIKPVLVLLAIAAVSAFLLAVVDHVTAPTIAENNRKSTYETYYKVLPEADSFTALDCDIDGVTAVLKADNGAGYVVTAQSRGYGGQVPAAVSFDENGNIIRVIMMANSETPGLGQKVTLPSFYDQFAGKKAEKMTVEGIDAVSGATISSRASVAAINLAVEAYQTICGGDAS